MLLQGFNMLCALIVSFIINNCKATNFLTGVKQSYFPLSRNPTYYSSNIFFRPTPYNDQIIDPTQMLSTPASFLYNIGNLDLRPKQVNIKTNINNESGLEYKDPVQKNLEMQDVTKSKVKLDTIEVLGITCDNNEEDGFFRAVLRGISRNTVPIFDEQSYKKPTRSECTVELTSNGIVVDVRSGNFNGCGVKNCTESDGKQFLCLRMRFPTVAGLRLPEDTTLILRCRIQEHMVSYTHRVGLSVNAGVLSKNSESSKNNKMFSGGATNTVRCQLNAFKASEDGQFTRTLANGEMLTLGEEVFIQIIVFNENVWRWSRLGDVWFSDELNTKIVPLVFADGCLNPEARAVCPMKPQQLGPFVHTLLIRTPMMSEGSSETNVVLNVKVVACRHQKGCTTRCARTSRTYQNDTTSNKLKLETINNGNKTLMNNPKVRDGNSNLLPYLSDAFGNDFEYVRYRSVLNENIPNLVNNDTDKDVSNDAVNKGFTNLGQDFNLRMKREVKNEANNVAQLSFVVVQDLAKVTAFTNQMDNSIIVLAIVSIGIVVVMLLIIVGICCGKNRKSISKEYLDVDFI